MGVDFDLILRLKKRRFWNDEVANRQKLRFNEKEFRVACSGRKTDE